MRAHIDCFTTLDSLTRKEQGDIVSVLRVLHRVGRFSVFDATENQTIANTMTRICQGGYIEKDDVTGYPWTKAVLTQKGRDAAGIGPAPEKDNAQ